MQGLKWRKLRELKSEQIYLKFRTLGSASHYDFHPRVTTEFRFLSCRYIFFYCQFNLIRIADIHIRHVGSIMEPGHIMSAIFYVAEKRTNWVKNFSSGLLNSIRTIE